MKKEARPHDRSEQNFRVLQIATFRAARSDEVDDPALDGDDAGDLGAEVEQVAADGRDEVARRPRA
jgi:hypothetical protein